MHEPLEALAERAAQEPFFLASVLAAYGRSEELDDAGLAAALGCLPGELAMLRLCRAPRPDPQDFGEDIHHIAERFRLDVPRLTEAVKRGRVVMQLQTGRPLDTGFLVAARDREKKTPDAPETP